MYDMSGMEHAAAQHEPPKRLASVMMRTEHDREVARLKARIAEVERSWRGSELPLAEDTVPLSEHERRLQALRDEQLAEVQRLKHLIDMLRRKVATYDMLRDGIVSLASKVPMVD